MSKIRNNSLDNNKKVIWLWICFILIIMFTIIPCIYCRNTNNKTNEFYNNTCPANMPCKSNTTQNCMKKLNGVCPGCTTDQSPISDKKVVGQWLETGTPVGTSYNMISAGLMDANKGFYQPPGKINFPLTTKYRFITYGGEGVGNNKFPSMDFLFAKWVNPWNCTTSSIRKSWQHKCGSGLGSTFNGIDFDMEGKGGEGLPYATFTDPITGTKHIPTTQEPFEAIRAFTKAVRFYAKQNNYPVPYFQLTVNGNIHDHKINNSPRPETPSYDVSDIVKVQDNFDFIALMLYGGKESLCKGGTGDNVPYGGWCIPDNMQPSWVDSKNKTTCVTKEENKTEGCGTSQYIRDWLINPDIDKTKIILGMADDSTSNQVKIFSQIVENHNLAGISFWKQQHPDVINTAGNLLLVP